MKTYNDNVARPKVTYEDIQRRKQEVLSRIRREENNIKRLTDALIDDYRRPGNTVPGTGKGRGRRKESVLRHERGSGLHLREIRAGV